MIHYLCILPILARTFKASDFVVVLGIVMVTTSLLMALRKRRAKAAAAPTAQEQIQQTRQHRGMRGDLETLMVEIEELSKRFASQLDAKSIQLEGLLNEADQRIARLERLKQDNTEARPSSFNATGGQNSPLAGQEAESSGGRPSTVIKGAANDPLTRSVYELADQGHDADQIARQLNEHVGKVELILALRQV